MGTTKVKLHFREDCVFFSGSVENMFWYIEKKIQENKYLVDCSCPVLPESDVGISVLVHSEDHGTVVGVERVVEEIEAAEENDCVFPGVPYVIIPSFVDAS